VYAAVASKFNKQVQTDKMSSNSRYSFFSFHLRSVLLAGFAFGMIHGAQILFVSFIRDHSLSMKPSALVTVIAFETIQSLVFIIIGVVLAYITSRILQRVLRKAPASRRKVIAVLIGAFLGVLFLPLCAGVSYFSFHEPDSPSYLIRCAEFALPMVAAGVVGSYSFWHFVFHLQPSHQF
jgi:hypothetical protein